MRESWAIEDERALVTQRKDAVIYLATHSGDRPWRGRPSIHMPRWASRIQLEVTDVRVERLNDISHDDCLAEGIAQVIRESLPSIQQCGEYDAIDVDPVDEYCGLWEKINGAGSWALNPFVWIVEFRRVS